MRHIGNLWRRGSALNEAVRPDFASDQCAERRRGANWHRVLLVVGCGLFLSSSTLPVVAQDKLSASASANADTAALSEHTIVITGRKTTVELVERLAKQIEAPAKLKRVDGFDPEVLDVKALSPTKLRLSALAQGYTTLLLTDEKDQRYVIEVFIKGDARHLQAIISNRFPNSSVDAFKINDGVILAGWVSQPDHITQITEIAEQFYPKVLNQMRVGGVQQVKLKCKVMEVQRSKLRQMGVNWLGLTDNAYFASTPGQLTKLGSVALTPAGTSATFSDSSIGAASTAFGFVTDAVTIQAYFDALKKEGLLKVLAEPTLVTMNGRPAKMHSGGEFPVIVPQSLGTTTIEWKDFGVTMEAVPIVLGEGRVRMEVQPEVSERDFSNAVTLAGITVPGLLTRKVNTQVEMKFGQTLMLAGLLGQRQVAQTQKVPFLGELPYAGALFRRINYDDVETDLVIILTPELVAPLDPGTVPPVYPGQSTGIPTDRELFGMGLLEVPNYGDGCDRCQNKGCPQCQQQQFTTQKLAIPVQEIRQSPQEAGFTNTKGSPSSPLPPTRDAQRAGANTRGGAQQVGHSEVRPNSSSTGTSNAGPSLSPRGIPNPITNRTTPNSGTTSEPAGKTSTQKPTYKRRPSLIEP